jgi:hypothetical protein
VCTLSDRTIQQILCHVNCGILGRGYSCVHVFEIFKVLKFYFENFKVNTWEK